MTDPISGYGNAVAPDASRVGAMGDQLGADTFLQLLVAQLKYQDPSSPTDSTEFLAQTAQFTMVEKLTALADLAESNTISSNNLAAASLVGRQVSWLDADGTTHTGVVESARFGSAGPVLVVDGEDVAFESVSAVTTTAPTTNQPTTEGN